MCIIFIHNRYFGSKKDNEKLIIIQNYYRIIIDYTHYLLWSKNHQEKSH